ncbi:unnamed protein product [Brachionus calyciflorus]|uniref:BZIP domain-containing protein n=1 Tax=Brachionus calyciflorus TaxID=104777 RepID=A0A813Q3V9_9BILA|nr:unnamed protein product [Brachionus calyciflorus]
MKLDLVSSNDLDLINQNSNLSGFYEPNMESYTVDNVLENCLNNPKRLKTMYSHQTKPQSQNDFLNKALDSTDTFDEIKMNGQLDYQQTTDYSNKYSNQNMCFTSTHQQQTIHQYHQQPQQQYNFTQQQYNSFYPSQYDYNSFQNQPVQNVQSIQAQSITPPPSNTNTPTPIYSNAYQLKNKNFKSSNRCSNLTSLLTKKEMNEDYEKDDNDDEEDDELSDEDTEDEDEFDSMYKNKKQKDLDMENDYEIKHNCLTEQGAYMNSLFNSPSSLSSSSGSKTNKKNSKKSEIKMENTEEVDRVNNLVHTENQNSAQQQHMNNMINSYSLAGIMNDYDLVNLPLRELNKRLRFLPKQMAYNLKKRRRTLKNRKYAQNCRSKRLEQKSEMEIQNSQLKIDLQRMNKLMEKLQHENLVLRNYLNSSSGKSLEDILDKNQMISTSDSTNSCSSLSSSSSSSTPLTPTTPTNCNQLTHLLSLPPVNYNSLHHSHPSQVNNNYNLQINK